MDWTFRPPDDAYHAEHPLPRVLLLGAEPNGEVDGPADCDMGTWMRDAHTNRFWNGGGRKFFRAQLLHGVIARAALGEKVEELDWYGAGSDGQGRLASRLMERLRVADLKAEAGDERADTVEVERWMLDHVDAVRALFEPAPDVVVLQGGHVQKLVMRHWERVVPEGIRRDALVLGVPHPSAAGYPAEAYAQLSGRSRQAAACRERIGTSPHRWSSKGWVPMHANQRVEAGQRAGNALHEQNLETLERAMTRLGETLPLVHTGEWTTPRRPGEHFNRLMLRYNGTIGLNLAVGAPHAALPFGCTVERVVSDDRGASRHRWTYTPGNPENTEAWERLFALCCTPTRCVAS